MQKLIIDARINEYTARDPNPNVPFSPAEIGADAAACGEAGASIVHYHARDPETGAPSSDPELYQASARAIRAGCDALIMPTSGANTVPDLDARFSHIETMAKDPAAKADLVPLDMASLSLAIYREVVEAHPDRAIVLGGDSAGGGLALVLLAQITALGLPKPVLTIALSPLTDLTTSGASIRDDDATEVVLPA